MYNGVPCVKVLVTHLCLTLCDPIYCSLLGSSVHEILQAKILEWVAISFSGYLPNPGNEHRLLYCRQIFLPSEPPGRNEAETILEEIMAENFPNWLKISSPRYKNSYQLPKRIQKKRTTCRQIINSSTKKILKERIDRFHSKKQ